MWKNDTETLEEFVAEAQKRGMTYGQLQQEETIRILRRKGFWEKKDQEKEK